MSKDEVVLSARGNWEQILGALAPHLNEALNRPGRHVPCPVHGGKDGFRTFKDVGETGGSVCNTCGVHTDGIATLMWANEWSFKETLEALDGFLHGHRPASVSRAPVTFSKRDDASENERLKKSLNRVWNETVSIDSVNAEPARLYMVRRGLSIVAPPSLRFHPALPYYDSATKAGEHPAIISMVTGANGNPVTIHRTYLTPDGNKANVESPKKLMAYPNDRKILGAAIRLMSAAGNIMAVAEGLETALAVAEGTGLTTWCAINALLLENFVPPASVERVLVFADKDRPTEQHHGGHGQEASRVLVQRLWKSGIKASAIVPSGEIPAGQKSLDWLDVLRQHGKAGFPRIDAIDARMTRKAA